MCPSPPTPGQVHYSSRKGSSNSSRFKLIGKSDKVTTMGGKMAYELQCLYKGIVFELIVYKADDKLLWIKQ